MADMKGKPHKDNSLARQLPEMPDLSNELTKATETRLGAFMFDVLE